MPLYEYQCTKCGHTFERIQKFSDPHVSECPKCGSPVEQLISAPAVQFKGSGWYVTDYAKKPSAAGSATSKDAGAKDGGAKEEKKGDSKETKSASETKTEAPAKKSE